MALQCLCKVVMHSSELQLDLAELRDDSSELFHKLCLEKHSILLFQLTLNILSQTDNNSLNLNNGIMTVMVFGYI